MKKIGLLLVLLSGTLTGCVIDTIAQHQPTFESVEAVRNLDSSPLSVGDFTASSTLLPQLNKRVSVRGSQLGAPEGGTFASYLKDTVIADLKAGGRYDSSSTTVITSQLEQNELNGGGISTANATLAATFSVSRAGRLVYQKLLSVTHQWDSSFMGAIAIPQSFNQYTEMYSRLARRLFGDEEFKAAVAEND